ncbi:hypothetical protein ANCDUO_15300, partial [Ancylostoma duodenale]
LVARFSIFLGEDGLDTDIPTELEAQLFTTPLRKFFWLLLQPLFYAFRPLVIYKKAPTDLEIVNAAIQVAEIAPEFYKGLHVHTSWTKVLFDFVWSPNMGPYMRLKRKASVPQTFKARHALNEYYQALLQHTGFNDLMRYARHWLDLRNNKKHVE